MRVTTFQGANGDWYWHVQANNNQIVQTSGEGYKTRWGAEQAAKKFLGVSRLPEVILLIIIALLLAALIWALSTRTEAIEITPTAPQVIPVKPNLDPPLTQQQVDKYTKPEELMTGK